VAGLPASAPQDTAIVTWHFRLADGSFDTIGPVEGNGAGGATPGQTYQQTIVGSTHGLLRRMAKQQLRCWILPDLFSK